MIRVLTGLRANGDFHLGNYLGSMQSMVALQHKVTNDSNSLHMFIADLHSFTTPIDHAELNEKILQNVKMYLAAGLDPKHESTTMYRQSSIAAHTQLAWVLSCFSGFGELSRMVEFKDKAARLGETSVGVGLFSYPVLMAADILLYDATYIPLGDDQKQHMELTRTLAERMNNKFGEDLFTVPAPWKQQLSFTERSSSIRIRSLQSPDSKMSKSVTDPKGTIGLLDDPKTAAKKVMSAETDSLGSIQFNWDDQPGITNLLQIEALLTNTPQDEVNQKWAGGSQYGELKKAVALTVEQFLSAFQAKYAAISDDEVLKVLESGEKRAREIADRKIEQVYRAVGLRN